MGDYKVFEKFNLPEVKVCSLLRSGRSNVSAHSSYRNLLYFRYVRREKEILVTKMEVTESNAERFKNRSNFLEKQLDETRACLEEERTKNHSSVLSLEQHQVCAICFKLRI